MWPTAGIDEDLDRTVVSVLVRQGDRDAGGRAGQGVGVGADSMRRALHAYTHGNNKSNGGRQHNSRS